MTYKDPEYPKKYRKAHLKERKEYGKRYHKANRKKINERHLKD